MRLVGYLKRDTQQNSLYLCHIRRHTEQTYLTKVYTVFFYVETQCSFADPAKWWAVDWIHMAQQLDRRRSLANTVRHFRVERKDGLLSSRATVGSHKRLCLMQFVSLFVSWLVRSFVRSLVGWLVRWLVGWLVGSVVRKHDAAN